MDERPIDFKDTLERIDVPSAIADRSGTLTWLNAAAREAFGDLTGQPVTSFVVPEQREFMRREFERKLKGAQVTNYTVDVITADGRRRTAELSSVPIRGGDRYHAVFGVAQPSAAAAAAPHPSLTPRQREVLALLGEGASTAYIAETLHLSRETVRNHVRHILRALGASSRLEAVAIAHREGLLGPR